MKRKHQKAWLDCQDMVVNYLYGYSQALRRLGKDKEAHVLEVACEDIEAVEPEWKEDRP